MDGNFFGVDPDGKNKLPSGDGIEGGDFYSWFSVGEVVIRLNKEI